MEHCQTCNQRGPVVIYIAKLFPKPDCSAFDAYGRIFSGSVKPGDKVRVLGEAYTPEDEEDSAIATVTAVWIYMGRYRIPVPRAQAGTPRLFIPLLCTHAMCMLSVDLVGCAFPERRPSCLTDCIWLDGWHQRACSSTRQTRHCFTNGCECTVTNHRRGVRTRRATHFLTLGSAATAYKAQAGCAQVHLYSWKVLMLPSQRRLRLSLKSGVARKCTRSSRFSSPPLQL